MVVFSSDFCLLGKSPTENRTPAKLGRRAGVLETAICPRLAATKAGAAISRAPTAPTNGRGGRAAETDTAGRTNANSANAGRAAVFAGEPSGAKRATTVGRGVTKVRRVARS